MKPGGIMEIQGRRLVQHGARSAKYQPQLSYPILRAAEGEVNRL
jgi:hypothetical protein